MKYVHMRELDDSVFVELGVAYNCCYCYCYCIIAYVIEVKLVVYSFNPLLIFLGYSMLILHFVVHR